MDDPSGEGVVTLRIHGLPAPQGSKSFKGFNGGRAILVENSKNAMPWRESVITQSLEQYKGEPLSGPLKVEITFWMPRPQSHYRTIGGELSNEIKPNAPVFCTSTTRGDLSKLLRCTEDGLSSKCGGSVIQDDNLIVSVCCEKRYVINGEGCGALINVVKR